MYRLPRPASCRQTGAGFLGGCRVTASPVRVERAGVALSRVVTTAPSFARVSRTTDTDRQNGTKGRDAGHPATSAGRLRAAFRALEHRDFRLFAGGQAVSLIGTWMQQVAMSWLVWRLTGSALALGAIGFATQLPAFVLAPVAGVLADRWSRHRMVVVLQALLMAQAVLLAVLTLTGLVQLWHLLALATILGVLSGFEIPARQAFFVELVGPQALSNAIALNATIFNGARLVGPAIAGLLVAALGEGPVFLLNAASFLAVLASLLAMRVAPRTAPRGRADVLRNLREGVGYAWAFPPMRTALLVLAIVSLVGMPYAVLLPVFASDVLGGDARTLGLLMSSAGLGALAGALYLASRTTVRGLGRVIAGAAIVFGVDLLCLSISRSIPLSCAILALTGFSVITFTASINTVLQTITDDDKRGRVVSLYVTAFMGMGTFGTLGAGVVASRLGAPGAVALGGLAVLVTAAWFARLLPEMGRQIRPVYVRLGIIPEMAAGIQTASELRPKA